MLLSYILLTPSLTLFGGQGMCFICMGVCVFCCFLFLFVVIDPSLTMQNKNPSEVIFVLVLCLVLDSHNVTRGISDCLPFVVVPILITFKQTLNPERTPTNIKDIMKLWIDIKISYLLIIFSIPRLLWRAHEVNCGTQRLMSRIFRNRRRIKFTSKELLILTINAGYKRETTIECRANSDVMDYCRTGSFHGHDIFADCRKFHFAGMIFSRIGT